MSHNSTLEDLMDTYVNIAVLRFDITWIDGVNQMNVQYLDLEYCAPDRFNNDTIFNTATNITNYFCPSNQA